MHDKTRIAETEIFARLNALHSALVEKLGAQPYLGSTDLCITGGGDCVIALYDKRHVDGGSESALKFVRQPTIAGALDEAETFVAAMPDPQAKARHEWHRDLSKVIDRGHDLALPDDVMEPLRASSQAMHKNLLAAPADTA